LIFKLAAISHFSHNFISESAHQPFDHTDVAWLTSLNNFSSDIFVSISRLAFWFTLIILEFERRLTREHALVGSSTTLSASGSTDRASRAFRRHDSDHRVDVVFQFSVFQGVHITVQVTLAVIRSFSNAEEKVFTTAGAVISCPTAGFTIRRAFVADGGVNRIVRDGEAGLALIHTRVVVLAEELPRTALGAPVH